jgi:hypothetical protein
MLADGRLALAEPLQGGRGWLLRRLSQSSRDVAMHSVLRLSFLGTRRRVQLGADAPFDVSLRHAEILALLALHPEGLTADQLTLHVYGETGIRTSTRVEISRLRKLLGSCLVAQPYRLAAQATADFVELERLVTAGRLAEAVDAYPGSLLPESDAPRIRQARDELEGAVQRAVLAGPSSCLWRWLQSEPGRDDWSALAEFVRRAPADDPRRPVAAARLRSRQTHR